jgi:hypothetical protein
VLSTWLFLRGLGLVFLLAFLSLWPQILGLIGSRGVLPAAPFLRAVAEQVGSERYRLLPTLFWLGAGDGALHLVCGLGIAFSLLLLLGVGRDFMGFQWDALLVETAICSLPLVILPLRLRPRLPLQGPGPIAAGRWLLFALLLRFMFAAAWAKLASGDATWRDLTALDYHFFTQPLPTPLAYYAHQLPRWPKQVATFLMFVIELVVPFSVLWPRARRWAALLLIGLQCAIAATGNYGFFNLLSALLAVPLLPDAWLRRILPVRLRTAATEGEGGEEAAEKGVLFLSRLRGRIAIGVRAILFGGLLSLSGIQALLMLFSEEKVPAWAQRWLEWTAPFQLANHYGLFAVMTRERPEIVIEGSPDGVSWTPYEFKYKPGALDERPHWSAPHQPRLDWQMWFAALRSRRRGGWFDGLCIRLLQGSPDVLWLFDGDPFQGRRPRYVRVRLYQYRFTTPSEQRRTGAYFVREAPLPFISPVGLSVGEP